MIIDTVFITLSFTHTTQNWTCNDSTKPVYFFLLVYLQVIYFIFFKISFKKEGTFSTSGTVSEKCFRKNFLQVQPDPASEVQDKSHLPYGYNLFRKHGNGKKKQHMCIKISLIGKQRQYPAGVRFTYRCYLVRCVERNYLNLVHRLEPLRNLQCFKSALFIPVESNPCLQLYSCAEYLDPLVKVVLDRSSNMKKWTTFTETKLLATVDHAC